MLTDKDIQKLIHVFATKQELQAMRQEMVTKKEFREKYDKFMNKLDGVYKEVRDMRQEQVVHLRGSHDRIQEEIDSTKARLKKVEAVVFP